MLMVISPAKTLDYESPLATQTFTQPALLEKSQQLIDVARDLSPAQIASLMGISDKLAHLNADRFNDWQPPFQVPFQSVGKRWAAVEGEGALAF